MVACTIAVMMMSVVRILGFKLSAFLSVYSALLALYYCYAIAFYFFFLESSYALHTRGVEKTFRVEDVNIVQNAFRFRILQIYSNLPVDEAFIQTEIGTF